MSVLYQCFSIKADWSISVTVHGKELVDGLNVTDKRYIYHLMFNIQLPGSKTFN